MIEGCKHGPKSFIPQPCADCERERVEADALTQQVGKQIARIVQEPANAAASIPKLTDLQRICNLNVMQAMAVQQYIERLMERPGTPTPARTTLICAAHMLDACAENMEKLCVGYGAEQMRGVAERLREGTPTLEQATQALPPSSPVADPQEIGSFWRRNGTGEMWQLWWQHARIRMRHVPYNEFIDVTPGELAIQFSPWESAPSASAAANEPKA